MLGPQRTPPRQRRWHACPQQRCLRWLAAGGRTLQALRQPTMPPATIATSTPFLTPLPLLLSAPVGVLGMRWVTAPLWCPSPPQGSLTACPTTTTRWALAATAPAVASSPPAPLRRASRSRSCFPLRHWAARRGLWFTPRLRTNSSSIPRRSHTDRCRCKCRTTTTNNNNNRMAQQYTMVWLHRLPHSTIPPPRKERRNNQLPRPPLRRPTARAESPQCKFT